MGFNFFNFDLYFGNFANGMPFSNFSCAQNFFSFPSLNCFPQLNVPMLNFNFNLPSVYVSDINNPFCFNSYYRRSQYDVPFLRNDASLFAGYTSLPYSYTPIYVPPAKEETKTTHTEREPEPETKKEKAKKKTSTDLSVKSPNGRVNHSYAALSKSEAEAKAKNDPNLEKLSGGSNWKIDENSFMTDIPYAKRGTGKILQNVAKMIGEDLVITSALGTAGANGVKSPHILGQYKSHHNAENPKLDIRASGSHIQELASKLRSTGYFSWVLEEKDHLDVQIDPAKYNELSLIA